MENNYRIEVKIPFPTKRHAEIAYDVFRIDEEPVRSKTTKTLQLEDNYLIVEFTAPLAKSVRIALTSFMEALTLSCETMDRFGPPVSEKYNHYYQ